MIESFLMNFSETHRIFAYIIIFAGMFIEGEVILILAGILAKSGKIDFFDTLIIAFIAVVFHDFIFWLIGQRVAKNGTKKLLFFNVEKFILFLENNKHLTSGRWLFFSKFAWSFNRFILMSSGYLKIEFSKIIRYALPAAFLWTVAFISLGYAFAGEFEILKKDVKVASILFAAFLAVIFILEKLLQKTVFFRAGKRRQ